MLPPEDDRAHDGVWAPAVVSWCNWKFNPRQFAHPKPVPQHQGEDLARPPGWRRVSKAALASGGPGSQIKILRCLRKGNPSHVLWKVHHFIGVSRIGIGPDFLPTSLYSRKLGYQFDTVGRGPILNPWCSDGKWNRGWLFHQNSTCSNAWQRKWKCLSLPAIIWPNNLP